MTKLVNLDDLAAPARSIKYQGVVHEVIDLPLQDFVAFQQDFNTMLEEQDNGNVENMLGAAYRIIERAVPSFTDYRKLNMRQMMAVVQLVADFYPAIADEAADAQIAAEAGEAAAGKE